MTEIVSLFRRQTVWSVAATTGTIVLILMLILQLSPMLAAPRIQFGTQSDVSVVVRSTDDPAEHEPAEEDPFARVPVAETPKPKPVAGDSPFGPAPRLDVKLLRLSPYDRNAIQTPETQFHVSATTSGRADQSVGSSGFPIGLSDGLIKPARRTASLSAGQKRDDADWRRYDSRRRTNLTQPLLTRGNPADDHDRRSNAGKRPFASFTESTASVVTRVTTPKIKFLVMIPKRLFVGNQCPLRFRMTNIGDAPATGVRVRIQLPPTLVYPKGTSLEYRVGTIPAGESRDARLTPRAIAAGTISFTVELERNRHVVERAVKTVQVAAPAKSRSDRSRIRHQPVPQGLAPCPCPVPPRQDVR